MKKYLILFFSFISTLGVSQTYNVNFDQVNWVSSGSGVSLSNDTLSIIGNASEYRTYKYTLDVDPNMPNLYFTARIYLENIQQGTADWDLPKIRIENTSGNKLINFNINSSAEGQWVHTGVELNNFKNLGLSQVVLILGVQNATGNFKVTDALVSSEPTEGQYVFPYTIPADPSVSLDVNTTKYHAFQNDLLSTNCHFTWASYTWDDENVKEVIYDKFPMENLRFPGGTVANFYNWQTDDFYDNEYSANNNTAYTGSQNDKTFGFPGYLDVTKTLGGSSTLLFNVFSDDKAISQARLQNRLDEGLDVKWIEMGNENYFSDQAYGFVDGDEPTLNGNGDSHNYDEYIKHTKDLAGWLKEIAPNVKVAVNTHDLEWNTPIASESYYDACVMHNYIMNNSFMMNQFVATEYLTAYRTTQNRLNSYVDTFGGDEPLLMTEWGLLSGMPASFLQVICAADNFLSIEKGNERGIVEQAGIHMLYHGNFLGEASLIMHNGTEFKLNPIGVMYSKLFDVFKNHNVYDSYSNSTELELDVDGVNAKAIDLVDSVYVFVVNKLPVVSPLNLSFDGTPYKGAYNMEHYAESMDSKLTNNYSLNENPWSQSSGTGIIQIPANSISIITIQKSQFQDICEKPNLGDRANLCGQSSVTLNTEFSNNGKTFKWYKDGVLIAGETASVLDVNESGDYKVIVDSLGCLREDEIEVLNHLPQVYLGEDFELCQTTSKKLDVTQNNSEIDYSWTKDEKLLSNKLSVLDVHAAGTYTVTLSSGSCGYVTDTVVVISNLIDVNYDTLCTLGIATFEINQSGNYAWYAYANGGTELSTNLTYEPFIDTDTIFYVQDNNIPEYNLGRTEQEGTLYGGTTDYNSWGRTMYLNVEKGVVLDCLDIFTNSIVDLKLTISGTGGNFQYNKSGIPNTGTSVPYTITPGMFIPEGNYIISLAETTGKVFVQVSDKENANLPGILEFGGTDGGNHYGYFYNWKISIPNTCSRTPVFASVNPENCTVTGTNEEWEEIIYLYPNVTSNKVNITKNSKWILYNAQGKFLSEGEGNQISFINLSQGIYFVNIKNKMYKVMKN